jgi:hypothetical protein
MGACRDERSQQRNRLPPKAVRAGFLLGKEKCLEEGGDEARVAFEEIGRARGRALVLALDKPTQACPAPANRHSTALRGWGKDCPTLGEEEQ